MLAPTPEVQELPTATLLEFRRALKYSEDEPRDDHGRWTGGGDLLERAVATYGITNNWQEAGYLLPDGRLLDYSGRHADSHYHREGDRFVPNGQRDPLRGIRTVDHESADLFGVKPLGENVGRDAIQAQYERTVYRMLSAGAARITGYVGAEIAQPMTPEQSARLLEQAGKPSTRYFTMDVSSGSSVPNTSWAQFDATSEATRIIREANATARGLTKLLKYSDDQPRDEAGRFAAAEGVRMAGSVRRGLEPTFQSERFGYPATGPVNGFDTHTQEYAADRHHAAFTSTNIGAYDHEGKLVGTFSLAHGGEYDGYFKVSVRPDAQRQGYGTALLREAERQGIDLSAIAAQNSYTPEGRGLLVSYLTRTKISKYSDSQPRDDHGRWTSGSGDAAIASWDRFAAADLGDPSVFKDKWNGDVAAAVKDLNSRHDYTKFSPTLAKYGAPVPTLQVLAALDTVMTQFPGVRCDKVSMGQLPPNMLAGTFPGDGNSIRFNSLIFGPDSEHSWPEMVSQGWGVKGTENPAGTAIHEFGHAYMDTLVQNVQAEVQAGQLTPDPAMMAFQEAVNVPTDERIALYRSLSGYPLAAAPGTGPTEMFADAFNAAVNPDSQSKDHPFAVAMQNLIDGEPTLTSAEAHAAAFWDRFERSGIAAQATKYSDDQPRDGNGRWISSGSPNLDLKVHAALDRWASGYAEQIRTTLARGSFPNAYSRMGETLLTAANGSDPTTYPLYRGIGFNVQTFDPEIQLPPTPDVPKFAVGQQLPMNLSSWTRDPDVARQFASNSFGTVAPWAGIATDQVVFAVEPGAHALNATYDIPQGPQYSEHVMAGLFEVTSVDEKPIGTMSDLTVHTIGLRQVATYEPEGVIGAKLVKYSPDEARDEVGRWTAEGFADSAGLGWPDLKTMKADYEANHPGTKLYLGQTSKLKVAEVMQSVKQLSALQKQFPTVKITSVDFQRRDQFRGAGGKGVIANTRPDVVEKGASWMNFNPAFYQVGGSPLYQMDYTGWHPEGTSNPDGYMTHEFGHAVQNALTAGGISDGNRVYNYQWGSSHYDPQFGGRPVSGYGRTNGKENFAEMFAGAYASDSGEKDASYATDIRDMLKRAGLDKTQKRAATLEKRSPLTFTDSARRALRRGYYDAYGAGWDDTGADDDPLDPEMQAAVDDKDGIIGPLLVGLGALLIGGLLSDAMLDARLGQYAATLNSMYEEGFGDGVQQQGEVTTATWRKSDEEACKLCDERDGTVWQGDEPHPYPGDGYYGDVCEGGPNCRCWLEYDIVPTDAAATTDVAPSDDVAAMTTADLLRLRLLLKYDPEQPRDWHGRWDGGGELEDGKAFWVGDAAHCRRMRDYLQSGADPKRYMLAGPARALLSAANRAAPTTAPLYRGIPVSAGRAQYFADLKPGDKIDLNLSSWTENKYGAQGFAGNVHGTHDPVPGRDPIAGSVVFTLEPGAHALSLNDEVQRAHGEGGYYSFTESVAAGRFEVTGNSWEGRSGDITLKQVGLLGPPPVEPSLFDPRRAGTTASTYLAAEADIRKYSPDQPRDDHGRWTADGGETGDPRENHPRAWNQVVKELNADSPTTGEKYGNCYEASAILMMNRDSLGLQNVKVIQATCRGQGPIAGKLFGHSWLEADMRLAGQNLRVAYDYSSGKEVALPASLYRQMGHAQDVHEYTPTEAMNQMVDTGHYGPWVPTGRGVL